MCGIAGAIRRIGERGEAAARPRSDACGRVVARMTEAERHRGPDGHGLWASEGQEVVFGHRRLAILDLSDAGAQPMRDPETGCVIVFNGEIYNFRALRRDLEAAGESFRSTSDTEVILKAHARWGLEAVERFRGIFAFALWDPRARAVHLVRDPMGIKPLYWTTVTDAGTGEELTLFASEVRALLASGLVPRRLDPAAVASYLWQGFMVGPTTVLEGVRLLPAATVLTFRADGPSGANARTAWSYWRMPASGERRSTVEDLARELASTVEMQLVSDVPLGVFLSGGIDSSAVAASAAGAARGPLHTFTIGFEEEAYDESRWAQRVAEALGTRHTRCLITEQDFAQQLPAAFTAIDQPTFDGVNTYFVSRAAREAGMTVALAGTGGDEVFGGYPSFVDIPRMLGAGSWLRFTDEQGPMRRAFVGTVTAGARLATDVSWDLFKVATPQTRWGKVADVARAAPDALALYQVSYALFTRETQAVLAEPAVRAAQAGQPHGLPPEVASEWRRRIAGSDPRHAVSLLELSSFIGERLLRDTDAASMAVALEVRVPLLDHVLLETVAGVDLDRRFSPPRRKQLLRDVALRGLDPSIFERRKSGFVFPIDTWARRRLQPQMEEAFSDEALARRAGLRGEALRTLWRSFAAGRPGLYWSRVWALFVLLSWCRHHDVSLVA